MSLNSKELFHSNVLAWFCSSYPKEAREVFSQWVPTRKSTIHEVKREKNNLDLVIEIPGLAPIVIENKVFAVPDNEQLDRYAEKKEIKNFKEPSLFLLSLGSPNWEGATFVSPSGLTWRYISYRDLSTALSNAVRDISGFDGDLIRHYVDVVKLLQEILDEITVLNPEEQVFLDLSTRKLLERIRMADAFGKLRARQSIFKLDQLTKSVVGNKRIEFNSGFTNGEPLIEGYVWSQSGDRLGWQYQANQWRLAVWTALHEGKTNDLRQKREKYVVQHYGAWFDFEPLKTLIESRNSKISKLELSGGFLSYAPQFVYRKRDVKGLTMSELEILSFHYLTHAESLAQ
jgi:hypothetical protein